MVLWFLFAHIVVLVQIPEYRDQANSFENQNLYFNRELSKNPDFKLFRVYADKGITGTKLHREEFDKMLIDAGLDILEVKNDSGYLKYVTLPTSRKPKFKYIFVKNTSRFARNVEVASIFRDLSRMGVFVNFLDLNKSTENEADSTYIQIFCSFDERESRDKRTKVLFGIAEGNKKGVIRTNGKLYGYRYIQKENRLEVIPEEAEVIKKIFTLYSQNLGIRQILNILEKEGILTRNGKKFGRTTIRNILDNEKYCGYSNNCKHYLGNDLFDKFVTPKRKQDGEYDLIESWKIPPIVDLELFRACKEILEGKINYENQKGVKKPYARFSGLLRCDICGNSYISNVDRGRRFYNCSTKKQFGILRCNSYNVSEQTIETELKNFLYNHKVSSAVIHQELIYWYSLARYFIEHQSDNTDDIKKLRQEEAELLEKLDSLYDLYASKNDSKKNVDFITNKIEMVEDEIQHLREKILTLSMSFNALVDKISFISNRIEEIKDINKDVNTIDDLIGKVIIYVREDGKLYTTYRAFTAEEQLKNLPLEMSFEIVGNMSEHDYNVNLFNNFCNDNNI